MTFRGLILFLASLGSLLYAAPVRCQQLPPSFFQINIKEVDQIANEAAGLLTLGMSETLVALNDGRKNNRVIAEGQAKEAIAAFEKANADFKAAAEKVGERKINRDIIKSSLYELAYESLVDLLRQNKYNEPVDSRTFIILFEDVSSRCTQDITILLSAKPTQAATIGAFLDLIAQKEILEKLGATSGIITIAMQ
jgi:hypothetical protein